MVEKNGTDNLLPLCNTCGLVAVPIIDGLCFACDLADKKFSPPPLFESSPPPSEDDMVTVTCEDKSIEIYREAAIALGLVE
jgi:hypothetical protein